MRVVTNSAKETRQLGRQFARILLEGDVVLLEGPLGAGKTVFVKGVIRGLGIGAMVRSPSFTLIREYSKNNRNVYHIDLYRIDKREELLNLGYQDFFYKPLGITLIEWGGRVEEIITQYIKVRLEFVGLHKRGIHITARGYPREKLEGIRP